MYALVWQDAFARTKALELEDKAALARAINVITDNQTDYYVPLAKLRIYQLPVPATELEKIP